MKISAEGLALIKRFEGFSDKIYDCPAGKKTIGYGHVLQKDELWHTPITEIEAEAQLRKDCHLAEDAVNALVKKPLKQCQFDALCSFVFNIGSNDFATSTLLKELNVGNYAGAAQEFKRWEYCKGKILEGLTKRRTAEIFLFLS